LESARLGPLRNDSTIGACATSRELAEPSAAGTSCIWSK